MTRLANEIEQHSISSGYNTLSFWGSTQGQAEQMSAMHISMTDSVRDLFDLLVLLSHLNRMINNLLQSSMGGGVNKAIDSLPMEILMMNFEALSMKVVDVLVMLRLRTSV
jgi:hypothetical protein